MSIISSIGNFFRSGTASKKPIDKYGILSILVSTTEYVELTVKYITLLKADPETISLLTGKVRPTDKYQESAVTAYHSYVKALASQDQQKERRDPLSVAVESLNIILTNIEAVEDNFKHLFDDIVAGKESAVRSSSLIVIGYLESSSKYATFLTHLAAHLRVSDSFVSPFWTKTMLSYAPLAGDFASDNTMKWSHGSQNLIHAVRKMQSEGTDIAIQTGDKWIDDFVDDSQFSHTEQGLLSASLTHPLIYFINKKESKDRENLEDYSAKKDWLLSRIALVEARANNLDPNSPDYAKLKKASDYYAGKVTYYDQKIERIRA